MNGQKLSTTDFGRMIQSKHPEYSDLTPDVVAQKVLAKFPQYQDMVTPDVQPNMGQRMGADIQNAGNSVYDAISGTGTYADKGPQTRAYGAVNDAFSAIPKVASEVLPQFARTGLEKVGAGIGTGMNWIGDKIGSNKSLQDFTQAHPEATNRILDTAGGAANAGGIAGNILAINGATQLANKLPLVGTPKPQGIQLPPSEPLEPIDKALVRGGVASPEEASSLAQTFKDIGINNFHPENWKIYENLLTRATKLAMSNGEDTSNLLQAGEALDMMKGVSAVTPPPVPLPSPPGLVSRLASGTDRAYNLGSKFVKTAATVGGTGYGVYRAAGGQPIFGSF